MITSSKYIVYSTLKCVFFYLLVPRKRDSKNRLKKRKQNKQLVMFVSMKKSNKYFSLLASIPRPERLEKPPKKKRKQNE
jgi:hypothetical protein